MRLSILHRQRIYNCPSDPTNLRHVNPKVGYATSSYVGNYLIFGVVDKNCKHRKAQGRAALSSTFRDGASNTILFAEKYAVAGISATDHPDGKRWQGGCHWAYFQADIAAGVSLLCEHHG